MLRSIQKLIAWSLVAWQQASCIFIIALPVVINIQTQWHTLSVSRLSCLWRARCKNGLSDDFGPTFTKPPNYLLSCNVTVAKWIVSCSQHIVLVIWIEFPPKLYQVTLLLARKVKLPKCQEIPMISPGGKKQFCCCPWWMWLKKKIANLTCSNGLPRQEKLFQKRFTLQNGNFFFTGNFQLSHLFRLATPSLPGSAS